MNSIPIHPTPSAYNTYYTPIAYSSQAPGLGISGFNFATCNAFNTLHFHSNANKKVIDTQCTSVLFSRVFVCPELRREPRRALLAPLPFLPSSHSSPFFSEVCALFSVTAGLTTLCLSITSALFSSRRGVPSFKPRTLRHLCLLLFSTPRP